MSAAFARKYTTGAGADIHIPIIKRAVVDFAVGADWTPAAGDVKISIDGGAAANIATLPVALAMGNTAVWKFVFSNAELTGKTMMITVADSATKVVEDQSFIIETYGHASAMYQPDYSAAVLPAQLGNVPHGGAAAVFTVDITGNLVGTVSTVTTLTNLPAITANWLTAAGTAADFGAELATAIWTDTTAGDFTVALSIGKSVMNGVTLGTGLTAARCTLTDTLTTYTGNTVQTGDSFARIGVAGAGLTGVVWNAAWDAEVQSEVDDGLVARGLHWLINVDVAVGTVADGSIIARLADKSANATWSSYVNMTSSLRALSLMVDDIGVAGAGLSDLGGMSTTMKAQVQTEAAAAITAAALATAANLALVKVDTAAILDDTGTTGVVLSSGTMNAIADALLIRSVTNTQNTADPHSLTAIILATLESARAGTVWTIRKTGGTTFTTKALTEDAAATPVTGVT